MKYDYRYIARIVLEAETPLVVGGGNNELSTDRPVAKDANGLPYIPGTSLTGVLRHALFTGKLGDEKAIQKLNDILGYQDDEEQDKSLGSRIAISSAHLIGKEGKVYDGLLSLTDVTDDFIDHFLHLPVRQHVRITHRGVADTKEKGKFDEEVLYKGTRLILEIEMKGNKESSSEDKFIFEEFLRVFAHPDFRIGSGSRKGFGRIKIKNISQQHLDLSVPGQRNIYLEHSSCLDSPFNGEKLMQVENGKTKYIRYTLDLKPEDFYLFSSADKGNSANKEDTADMTPVTEKELTWDNPDNPDFSEELVLIPASSVIGALSHRVAYHYNKKKGIFADMLPKGKTVQDYTGENNEAVKVLFGEASKFSDNNPGHIGNVLPSDVFLKEAKNQKKLEHVAIDRFTGGGIDGALFNENVINDKSPFRLEFNLDNTFCGAPENLVKDTIIEAFETALKDICSGCLPLGGGTMRGHGVFNGSLKKIEDGKEKVLYSDQ